MPEPSRSNRGRTRTLAGLALGAAVALGVGTALYALRSAPVDAPDNAGAVPPGPAPRPMRFLVTNPNGQPVAGAQIVVEAGNTCRHVTTSGADGQAETPGCLPGPVSVRTEAPGLARAETTTAAPAGAAGDVGARVNVRLAWGMRLQGLVVDERGAGVAAAQVSVQRAAPGSEEEPWIVITSESGRFSLDTLPAESLSLEVSSALHERTVLPGLAMPASGPLRVVIARTAAISGKVTGTKHEPVAMAEVQLAGSGIWPAQMARTDAAGTYRFEPVPEGIYELRARLGALVSEPFEGLSLDAGEEAKLDLALSPGARLQGRVFDARTGLALEGARVQLAEDALSATVKSTTTPATGTFALDGLLGVPHRLAVSAAGYVAFDGWVRPASKPLEVGLLRSGVLVGRVVDEDGEPVASAELEVRGQSEIGLPVRVGAAFAALPTVTATATPVMSDDPAAGDDLGVTQGRVPGIPLAGPLPGVNRLEMASAALATAFHSDEHGGFRLEGLPPGSLRVFARKAGFAPSASDALLLAAGALKEGVTIVLSRGGAIVGRLVDSDGAPVEHVRLEFRTEDNSETRSALSDRDGGFRFDAVRGRCRVTAYPYGLPPVRSAVLEVPPRTEQSLSLLIDGTTHTLEGRVVDRRDRPVENATISVRALDARSPFAITVLTGPDGRFEAPGLPPPPYRVSADQAEYAPSAPTRVSAVSTPVLITLTAGSDVRGIIIDGPSNEPLAGARVSLLAQAPTTRLSARSRGDGSFEFLHVRDGHYSLFVEAAGMVPATRTLDLGGGITAAGGAPEQAFVLIPAGSASGDVVDRLGAPLWNAEVGAGSPPDWTHATHTDHAGHFVLTGLRPGDTALSARERSAGEATLGAPVRVYPGQETPGVVLRLPGLAGAEPESDSPPATTKARRRSGPR